MPSAFVATTLLSALLLAPTTPSLPTAPFGGWATINADPLPETVVPGRKVQLTFLIKQHGVTPMAGLKPTVELKEGSATPIKVDGAAGKDKGYYTAELTFPRTGDWHITIHSGFGESRTTLPILKVTQAVGQN